MKWDTVVVYRDYLEINELLSEKVKLIIKKGELKIENTTGKELNVEIFDALGKKVYKVKAKVDVEGIDLTSYAKGVYVVQIQSEHEVMRKKVCWCSNE